MHPIYRFVSMSKLQSFFGNNLSSSLQAVVAATESPLLTLSTAVRIHYQKSRSLSLYVWVGVYIEHLHSRRWRVLTYGRVHLMNVVEWFSTKCVYDFNEYWMFPFSGFLHFRWIAGRWCCSNVWFEPCDTHTHHSWVCWVGLRYAELMELMLLWWHRVNSTVHI